MTTTIHRLGSWVVADEVFLAWSSGDLERMIAARNIPTNPIDRRFLLQSIVKECYRRRREPRMMSLCIETGLTHLDEFAKLADALRAESKGTLPFVPSFVWLANALAECSRSQKAIRVCQQAAELGLEDGTKGGYRARALRILRGQLRTDGMK